MPEIGFAILTHSNPAQTLRLTRTLLRMFRSPKIVIHHDFSQCPIGPETIAQFDPAVRFLRPYFQTQWGAPSLNDATLAAVDELYRVGEGPDWVVLLSGMDYPIKSAQHILSDLNRGGVDVYLKHQLVHPRSPDFYNREMSKRYMRWIQRIWWIDRHLKLRTKTKGLPIWASKWLLPFDKKFQCFAGSQWFTANRKSAQRLLELHQHNPLRRHYWRVPVPDESYIHCLWVNQLDLRIADDNRRYTDHHVELPHPRTLHVGDLPALINSAAHFARKFEPDDPVLDRLDEQIGITGAAESEQRSGDLS